MTISPPRQWVRHDRDRASTDSDAVEQDGDGPLTAMAPPLVPIATSTAVTCSDTVVQLLHSVGVSISVLLLKRRSEMEGTQE